MKIIYYPPLNIIWYRHRPENSGADIIHTTYCRELWKGQGLAGRIKILAYLFTWPFLVPALAAALTLHLGPCIKRRSGKRLMSQFCEQIKLAAMHGVLPLWYYSFELYDEDKCQAARSYIHRFETKGGILRLIRQRPSERVSSLLRDKGEFARFCVEHGFATAPVFLASRRGCLRWIDAAGPSFPESDLFIKPIKGKGGSGAERWDYQGAGTFRGSRGDLVTESELLEHVKSISSQRGYLVQQRLVNHPEISDLSNGALTTVRLMTCRNEQGGYEPTNAVFRMARGDNRVVDNFHAGGIAAKVDIRTGRIAGPASDMGLNRHSCWHDRHPDTGAEIVGRQLPLWNETVDLALRAHTAFGDYALIGWDIGLTAHGPVLVEGNRSPDLDIVQRTHREPIGNCRLGELLAFHVHLAVQANAVIAAQPVLQKV